MWEIWEMKNFYIAHDDASISNVEKLFVWNIIPTVFEENDEILWDVKSILSFYILLDLFLDADFCRECEEAFLRHREMISKFSARNLRISSNEMISRYENIL
jgi:hypothetical protein